METTNIPLITIVWVDTDLVQQQQKVWPLEFCFFKGANSYKVLQHLEKHRRKSGFIFEPVFIQKVQFKELKGSFVSRPF